MIEPHGLLNRAQCCLVVIDVQQYFLDKLPLHEREPLVDRIAWLMRVARLLEIPIIGTAEDIKNDGPLVPALMAELPAGAQVFDKKVFGLMAGHGLAVAGGELGVYTFSHRALTAVWRVGTALPSAACRFGTAEATPHR